VLENFDWVPVRVIINNKIQKFDTFHDRSSECGMLQTLRLEVRARTVQNNTHLIVSFTK